MTNFDRLLQRSVLVAQLPVIEGVPQADEHAIARERLLDEIERALLGGLDRGADRPVAGDDDHRQRVVHRAQTIEHLDAVHARHLHVEQHEVRRLTFSEREAFLAGRRADDVVPFVLEGHFERVADRRLVVDDKNAEFGHLADRRRAR